MAVALLNTLQLALSVARRNLRGGLSGPLRTLGPLVAGVFIGVAAIAFVATASQALRDGAKGGALEAVGGDVSLRLFHRFPNAAEFDHFSKLGRVSLTAEVRPMAQAKGRALLVELKGVDSAYPLFGRVRTSSSQDLHALLQGRGAVVDPALLEQLDVGIGDFIRLGDEQFEITATLSFEPDRAFRAFTLGPRIMVALDDLRSTGLVEPGAEFYSYSHIKTDGARDGQAVLDAIDAAFPNSGWRMVDAADGVPGVERTLMMAEVMVLFIGLGVMLIGGAGISGAVRAHISAKLDVIAILKSIGTPPAVIVAAFGFEVALGAVIGAVLGMGVGAFAPLMVANALSGDLPFALSPWPHMGVLVGAGAFGLLVAALFAWWPLMALYDVPTRQLLRERFEHTPGRPGLVGLSGVAALGLGLASVIFALSPMPVLSGAFLVAGLVLAAVYFILGRLFARLAKVLAKRLGERRVLLRLALGNLYRPGAPTGPVVMALGLTLTLLVALDGIETVALRHAATTLPARAPDVVAFSIPKSRAEAFEQTVQRWGGVESVRVMPFLHARVQAVEGIPVRKLDLPGSIGWVIRGDRGVSFADAPPEGTLMTEGRWWSDQDWQRPLLSVDSGIADKMGVGLGDEITLNVSGHVVTGRISNLRQVDWTGLDLDFPIIASPMMFQGVPHTYAAAVKVEAGAQDDLRQRISEEFPELPIIIVDDLIAALAGALEAVLSALRIAAVVSGIAALVVMAGSVSQGLRERTDEALLFKVLGARRAQLLRLLALEFFGLGVLVSLAAWPLGLVVADGVARAAKLPDAHLDWAGGATLAAVAVAVCVVAGLAVTWGAYASAPARYLRRREV